MSELAQPTQALPTQALPTQALSVCSAMVTMLRFQVALLAVLALPGLSVCNAANAANAANENPSDESIALWTWLREHDEISLELLPYMAVKRKKLQRGYAERGEAIGDPQSEAAAFRVIVSRGGRDLGLSSDRMKEAPAPAPSVLESVPRGG